MNKSLDFILKRIKESESTYNMPTEGWEDATILNPMVQLKEIFKEQPEVVNYINEHNSICSGVNFELNGVNDTVKITTVYNPDAEFSYFTNVSSTHDGTFVFIGDNIRKILQKVLAMETYDKRFSTDEIRNNIFDYTVKYTIGDLVMHSDFGTKNINGHMWPGQTDILCLPIKYEVFKKENSDARKV